MYELLEYERQQAIVTSITELTASTKLTLSCAMDLTNVENKKRTTVLVKPTMKDEDLLAGNNFFSYPLLTVNSLLDNLT